MSLFREIISGNRQSLAQCLTSIENEDDNYHFLSEIYGHTGNAHLIGITGSPGSGKSTILNSLVKLMRKNDDNMGILAIDPSSQFTKGAVLGDRIRMQDLLGDKGVYIRSMATRGALGGLSNAVAGSIDVLDAAGFDRIFVETSGVGQAEIDIAANSYTTIVVLLPGAGDSIQASKAGVLEIADIIVINKSDYSHASLTKSHLLEMLDIASHSHNIDNNSINSSKNIWSVPIVSTVATSGEGVDELADNVYSHYKYLCDTGELEVRRRNRIRYIYRLLLQKKLYTRLENILLEERSIQQLELLMQGQNDPYTAVEHLMEWFDTQEK